MHFMGLQLHSIRIGTVKLIKFNNKDSKKIAVLTVSINDMTETF